MSHVRPKRFRTATLLATRPKPKPTCSSTHTRRAERRGVWLTARPRQRKGCARPEPRDRWVIATLLMRRRSEPRGSSRGTLTTWLPRKGRAGPAGKPATWPRSPAQPTWHPYQHPAARPSHMHNPGCQVDVKAGFACIFKNGPDSLALLDAATAKDACKSAENVLEMAIMAWRSLPPALGHSMPTCSTIARHCSAGVQDMVQIGNYCQNKALLPQDWVKAVISVHVRAVERPPVHSWKRVTTRPTSRRRLQHATSLCTCGACLQNLAKFVKVWRPYRKDGRSCMSAWDMPVPEGYVSQPSQFVSVYQEFSGIFAGDRAHALSASCG
eukprot:353472-Chlamydomonas_euryale.AAC.7